MQKFITDIKSLAALLMAGAAFAACSSEDNMIGGQPASQQTYTMTIEASKGGGSDATTRALSIDGSGALNATWETSNEVKAYNYTQSSALTGSLKPQSNGVSATLTGSLTGSVAVDDIIFLRWPSVDADYTGQDGTLETIAQRYDYTTGVAKVTSVNGTTIGAEDSSHGGPVLFTNNQTIVKFTLTDKANDAPIRATQLTIDAKFNGESRLIQSITYPDAYKIGPITINRTEPTDNVIYAALPFSSQANFTFSLTATDGTNTYTYEKAGVTMLNGRYYEITVKMNASQATPLTFEAKEAGASVTFKTYTGSTVSAPEYSTDGSNWTHYTWGTAITLANVGDKVMFRGDNATYAASSGTDAVSTFTCDKDCYVYGNVMSLVSPTGYESATTLTAGSTFRRLFYRNTHLLNHPTKPIVLPATTLADNCYFSMFEGCSGLTKAPTLPATTMKPGCYMQMFSETGIAVAPALPATTLAQSCYEMMFFECPNLTMPPGLPATKLESLCYAAMFGLCPNLGTAPALPATTLVNSCYYGMFSGCTSLNSVTCLATDISAKNCTYGWLTGVAATGTFTKAGEMTGWTTGGNGIPEGWTVNSKPVDLSTVTADFTAQDGVVLTGRLTRQLKVTIANGATVTLRNAAFNPEGNSINLYPWAGLTCLGNATIILEGENSAWGFHYNYPGIEAGPEGTTLTIRGTGSLSSGSHDAAGIGGITTEDVYKCGNILIESGTVTATGGLYCAGIGTGYGTDCGNITISGGTVTAQGGRDGAGIGSGWVGTCGDITISGGTVSATAGYFAAGIGTGAEGSTCGNITITSGISSLTATSGDSGASPIGKGTAGNNPITCGTITIDGTTAWTAGTPTTNLAWAVSNKGQTWALTPKN